MTSNTLDRLAGPSGFAAAYSRSQEGRDEMLEPDGALRPHWSPLVSLLDDLGSAELLRRWELGRRLIRENGITHNIYGDPNGLDRPWNLDLIPLLLPAAEWRTVAAGLTQRARLLDALLADLYGPARSISEGWLPAELLFANPGFLRPLHGVTLPHNRWLHMYSADFVRLADGEFRVVSDRTQAPSGAGYSLENRIVISSVLSSAFRQANVERLAPFFISLRQTLRSLAPPNRENPRVVVLTPGPYNETYFEHAYLARYLGYTLVQGNDLTVRDGNVFLKTLSGLQRVDVILRRVDDDFCDPLELYQDSFLGVPGLVEAVREGNVAVSNALGSGMAQSPGFLSYLPVLCRHLLGEELKLPSVQTWWCGDSDSRRFVLENLATLVIKPAFVLQGSDPQFGSDMSRAELAELADRISARPAEFIAQEMVQTRTAPVFMEHQAEARRFVIRGYAVAEGDSFNVMSGGLTRVTGASDSLVVSMQRGGGSKDTWILSEGAVTELTLLAAASRPVELSRGGGELTSRVADDLFWLARYVQRFESNVRIARSLFNRVIDQGRPDSLPTAGVLTRALFGAYGMRFDETRLDALTFELLDTNGPGGLRRGMAAVRNLVRGLRDRVSADAWRILQGMERELAEFDAGLEDEHVARTIHLLNDLIVELLAFSGVIAESMTRGQAWRFLDMGNRIERSLAMARLLGAALCKVEPFEPAVLDALLEIADSSLTYRRRYLTQLDATAIVDLLVGDESNPRSILFQVLALQEHLQQLPRETSHPRQSPDKQAVLRIADRLKLADFPRICQPGPKGRMRLAALLRKVIDAMEDISQAIGQIYFSHAAVSRNIDSSAEERPK
ncbi:MAG TPA: circularly permuted type 2 ATP-grasp protein [Humisphaera sp.]|jgi:uncharacterized circularly permuted ATP-grasp superfamily protein/uncharacterized alpha-E superfamily protein|nr:circularly permuted type 2 ATP-grasp protein [Humisphaera sp.]